MSQDPSSETRRAPVPRIRNRLRDALLEGIALTVPLFVTLLVFGFVANFVAGVVQPVVGPVRTFFGLGGETPDVLIQAVTVLVLFGLVLLVGLVSQVHHGSGIEDVFDATMARIPALGSVYTSFSRMSDVLLDGNEHSFREVYLVEYPTEGSYTLAFLTTETPEFVAEATGHDEMMTLFMPMAPNPVMGGFVVHVAADRVYDVDMTVEEGLQSIVTSGVATTETAAPSLSPGELAAIGETRPVERKRRDE